MQRWAFICVLLTPGARGDEDLTENDASSLLAAFHVDPVAQAVWDEAMSWSPETSVCGSASGGWTGVACTDLRVTKVDMHLVDAKAALKFTMGESVGGLSHSGRYKT
jgi:hypothetical protein